MRVQFINRENGPERLVCDAEILFDEGPLAGMKLVGFALWNGACLLYTSPSPRDRQKSRMPSSA